MKKLTLAIGAAILPGVASAHPDHVSGGSYGLVHLISDPFHLALIASAVGLFLVARRQLRRRRAKVDHS